MEDSRKMLNCLVACLRTLYLVNQNSHWRSKGPTFYGDHLMFQRIYETAASDADSLAEKMIGLFGNSALNQQEQAATIASMLTSYMSEDSLSNSTKAETYCKDGLSKAISQLEAVSPGLDNLLRTLYDNREGSLYLLRQRAAS